MRNQAQLEEAYYANINAAADRFAGMSSLADTILQQHLLAAGTYRYALGSAEDQAIVETLASFLERVAANLQPPQRHIGDPKQ